MREITCINEQGTKVLFTYDHDKTPFFLVNADGVYSMKNNINTTQNATSDGVTYNGEGLDKRAIVITANIYRDHQANREKLTRVFKNGHEGTLINSENGIERKIKYRVESIDVPDKGVIRTATINLTCVDPYYTDGETTHIEMAAWADDFEFELEIDETEGMEFGTREKETIRYVDNESTTDIGIKMTIQAEDTVVNPKVMNVTTGETLKLLCTMIPEDKIVITTQQGNIDVILIRNGEEIDYNYTVDEDNEGYIQLTTGRNYINYTADTGNDFMNVEFDFENKYIMP